MDVTSAQGPDTRSRAKNAAKDPSPKPARKTITASRKKTAPPAATVVATTADVPLDLSDMIAKAAFYLAAERGFAPGHELDDWLEAERRIRTHYAS